MSWQPSLGAWPEDGGVRFRIWAPAMPRLWASFSQIAPPDSLEPISGRSIELTRGDSGIFSGWAEDVKGPHEYLYYSGYGMKMFPDPASRFQPEGVHGPSEIIDPSTFPWTDRNWRGIDRDRAVIYEMHVGTFTPEGTFRAAEGRLAELADLGVTAVQLLPVNDFPGRWNWGYDGVALFAPARCYGRPDDLRRLVDRAHSYGMAILLDVVYNHFGPDGNYTGVFSRQYVRDDRVTNWGPAINLGGPGSEMVRAFLIENALMWIHEYHCDGFRLDATHAFVDDGPRPFLEEFAETVRASVPDRQLILIAEDHRNLGTIIRPASEGGWDFDGVWSDDFHHELRRYLTGDHDGVFQDFRGTTTHLARAITDGWLFCGQYSAYREKNRGTDPTGIPPRRFVFSLQNHDRVGNRAGGRRLNHDLDPATYRAATALLLMSPETPMLFMGQEWAAGSPFFYFTDHVEELGRAVRQGRSHEFRRYADFTDPARLATIPDPQAESSFQLSKLDRAERFWEPHASTLRLYRELLRLRRDEPAFHSGPSEAHALGEDGVAIHLGVGTESEITAVVRLRGLGPLSLGGYLDNPAHPEPELFLTTEDAPYAPDPSPIRLTSTRSAAHLHFARPGAALIRHRSDTGT